MSETFHDRLKILMGNERPYSWSKKVGIDKGLFQYYWQKKKVPTHLNLIKIQNHTGCSLDWLLTGKSVAFEKIVDLPKVSGKTQNYGKRNLRLAATIEKVAEIYSKKADKDIEVLEHIVETLLGKKK